MRTFGATRSTDQHTLSKGTAPPPDFNELANGDDELTIDDLDQVAGGTGASAQKLQIDPNNLDAAAVAVATAVHGGLNATTAIGELSTASAQAHVSFDKMVLLTDQQLHGMTGVTAAETTFNAEIVSRLGSGATETALTSLVKTGAMAANDAATTIIGMAQLAEPGAVNAGHAVDNLLSSMHAAGVAQAQIDAAANANAATILTGISTELGKGTAPTAADIAAAADVLHAQVTGTPTGAAFTQIETEFRDFQDTAAGRTAMAQIESLGLTAAVQDGTITAAEQLQWQTAFVAHPDVTTADFRITAANPTEAVHFLANAIEQGFAPGTAIQLIETGAQHAGVSADNMLLMADTVLNAAQGNTAAAAGVQAIQAEIAARLQDSAAAIALGALGHASAAAATTATATLLAEEKLVGATSTQIMASVATEFASALQNGLPVATAISELQTVAAQNHFSFDNLMLLTDKQLKGLAGTMAATAAATFSSDIKARLTNGAAAVALTGMVKAGTLDGASAGNIIAGMAELVEPGAVNAAHAVDSLLSRMKTAGVVQTQIETAAVAEAQVISTGIRDMIRQGTALTAADIAAAADVLHAQVTGTPTGAAFTQIEAEFLDFQDTAAGRTAMAQIESLGLTAAVQDGTISAAEQLQWQAAFVANPDVTPANFRITATNPGEAAQFLANAIEQGFAPGTAIQLLETGAQNAGISADNLLLMTNAILSAVPANSAAAAGVQAIQAEIAARLHDGAATTALAALGAGSAAAATTAAATLVAEERLSNSTVAQTAHDLSDLLNHLSLDGASAATVEAVAKIYAGTVIQDGGGIAELASLGAGSATAEAAAAAILLAGDKSNNATVAQTAHDLANLMAQMTTDGASNATIEAVAAANAVTIMAGIRAEIAAGTPLTGADIAAAAAVFETGLGTYSNAAAAKLASQYQDLAATPEGPIVGTKTTTTWVVDGNGNLVPVTTTTNVQASNLLTLVEEIAMKNAAVSGKITIPAYQQWADGLRDADPSVFSVAVNLLNAQQATPADAQALGVQYANILVQFAISNNLSVENLMTAAASDVTDFKQIQGLQALTTALVAQFELGDAAVAEVNSALIQRLAAPGMGPVDATTLVSMLQAARPDQGGLTEAQTLSIVQQSAAAAGNGAEDQWLLSALNAAGGVTAAGNSPATAEIVLAIMQVMSQRFNSGAMVANIESEVSAGKLTMQAGIDTIVNFSQLAMANAGFTATGYNFLGNIEFDTIKGLANTQVYLATGTDGSTADTRAEAAILQYANSLIDTPASAANNLAAQEKIGQLLTYVQNNYDTPPTAATGFVVTPADSYLPASVVIAAVEALATATGHSVEQALVNVNIGAGGNAGIAAEEAARLGNGAAAKDLAHQMQAGTYTGATAAALIEQEAHQASSGTGTYTFLAANGLAGLYALTQNATVQTQLITTLAAGLADGSSPATFVAWIANGSMTGDAALNLASQVIVFAQKTAATYGVLPGIAEGEVVLAQISDAVNAVLGTTGTPGAAAGAAPTDASIIAGEFNPAGSPPVNPTASAQSLLTAFQTELSQNYSEAIAAGNVVLPLAKDLGLTMATAALNAGQSLFAIANPTAGTEAPIVANLIQLAEAAGVSVDGALTLAAIMAAGRSETLKIEMTDRLLSGAAEANIASLIVNGSLAQSDGTYILTTAVDALAADNGGKGALGLDVPTATAFVLARLDLAAGALLGNPPNPAVGSLQSFLVQNYASQILTGLGAVIGLLSVDPTDNAAAITAAQALLSQLLPGSIGLGLGQILGTSGQTPSSSAIQTDVINVTTAEVQSLVNAYDMAQALGQLETSWTSSNPSGISDGFSAALQTFNFDIAGVGIGASTSTTLNLGGGFDLTLADSASIATTISSNGTSITIDAAAKASAMSTLDLGGHAKVAMLAQAIANGSIVASVDGVTVEGNVSVGASVTVSQGEQGSLGISGLSGLENVSVQAGVNATVEGKGSIGVNNEVSFGAMAGADLQINAQAGINIEGVAVTGGLGVTVGEVGASANLDVNFDNNGNLDINIAAALGLGIFGISFNLDIQIPTSLIVSALNAIGLNVTIIADTFKMVEQAFASIPDIFSDLF
jgi:hypothetical protein